MVSSFLLLKFRELGHNNKMSFITHKTNIYIYVNLKNLLSLNDRSKTPHVQKEGASPNFYGAISEM